MSQPPKPQSVLDQEKLMELYEAWDRGEAPDVPLEMRVVTWMPVKFVKREEFMLHFEREDGEPALFDIEELRSYFPPIRVQRPEVEEKGPAKLPEEVVKNLQNGGKAHEGIGPSIGHIQGLERADFR